MVDPARHFLLSHSHFERCWQLLTLQIAGLARDVKIPSLHSLPVLLMKSITLVNLVMEIIVLMLSTTAHLEGLIKTADNLQTGLM